MRTPILLILILILILIFIPFRALAQSPATAPSQLPITNYQLPTATAPSQFPIPNSQFPSLAPPGSRILKTFDFEERKNGNFESIPMFWSKVQGIGFPAYSSGEFDHTTFHVKAPGETGGGGDTSFKLHIDGGSAAFRYTPGKLPINPNADYFILAYVKTTPLHHARAQISAWFGDDQNQLLKEPAFHSEPYASPPKKTATTSTAPDPGSRTPDPDSWHLLHLYIPGPGPDAPGHPQSLVLQLGLLQPQQLAAGGGSGGDNSDLGEFALYEQDLQGAAWFDDITIIELPRLSISVPSTIPANIFAPNQKIELDLAVSDVASAAMADIADKGAANVPATMTGGDASIKPLPSQPLVVTLKITDPDGLLFASEKSTIPAAGGGGEIAPWTRHFTHAPLPPGLYLATLEVSAGGGGPNALIARRQTRFLCLAPAFAELVKPAPDFGFAIPRSTDLWPVLPQILRHTRAGLVQLPAWREDMSEDALLHRDPPFDALLASMQRLDIHAIATFPQIPAILSAKFAPTTQNSGLKTQDFISPDSILALAQADTSLWRPYVSFLLSRYANRIDFWEFGSPADPYSGSSAPSSDSRYSQLFAKTSSEMSTLIDRDRLVIPWNALFDFDAKRFPNAQLDLILPASIKPSQIPAYIDNFKQATGGGKGGGTLLAHIEPLAEKQNGLSHTARLNDFAKRLVYARLASPTAILIDLPIAQPASLGSLVPGTEPDEILAAYRTLIQAMGGSEHVRELALAPGLKCFLFSRINQDTLIVWSESEGPGIELDLPLGPSPQVTSLLGAARPLPVSPQTRLAHVTITNAPIILHHIDSRPVQLRASFALAAGTFPAGAGSAQTEILLANPFPDTLAGTLQLSPPDGWSTDPPSITFSLAPGKSLRQAVTIRYPFNEYSGSAAIAARLALDNGTTYDLSAPAAVKSDLVELDASLQFLPNGDLVIQQIITNIGHDPIDAQAYVLVPGYPRAERYIIGLAPRQTIIKRFTLPLSSCVTAPKNANPADLPALLAGKSAALGLKENDGRTLIAKALPLQ